MTYSDPSLTVLLADYQNAAHADAIVTLLDTYSRDPYGSGRPLPDEVKAVLVEELAKRDFSLCVLAYLGDQPVGLIIAFEGFSTFAAKPLLNLHDIVVTKDARGKGIATAMMAFAEQLARERGCCKLTLEVLSGNTPAYKAYEQFGFAPYQLDPDAGSAMFLEKKL